jgi:hypothetical protein
VLLIIWSIGLQLVTSAESGATGENTIRKVIEATPLWETVSRRIISYNDATGSGLKKMPFPDVKNPVHVGIWNALKEEGKIGDGFGTICNYFGVYLVNISINDQLVASYFYDATNHTVHYANQGEAFARYKGNREATITNIIALVRNLLAVTGEEAIIVDSPEHIPHKMWQTNHPKESFSRYLRAKGIDLHEPEMLKGRENFDEAGWRESSECNVFAYFSHGGEVIRYEVQFRKGHIVGVDTYVLGRGLGDCWYTM